MDTSEETFGHHKLPFETMAHLLAKLDALQDGEFKSGFESAIEEMAAGLDSKSCDEKHTARTLVVQMIGLVNGCYYLVERPGDLALFPKELTEELRQLLALSHRFTGPVAHTLRNGGEPIPQAFEDEHPYVLHWMINLYLKYGVVWREKVVERMLEIASERGGRSDNTEDLPGPLDNRIEPV